MAYRIRNFDNLSVHQVDEIFRRGRGLGRSVAPAVEGEDFAPAFNDHNPMPPAEVIDDELELVR